MIQLQPLEANVVYEARVQSVSSSTFAVSAFSTVLAFKSNSTRVDNLRRICTGFFEDFNHPAGPFDPAKCT
jgi:hypothetical protein